MTTLDIKHARKGLGLTQRELADVLHVQLSTINKWERDKSSDGPTLAALEMLLWMDQAGVLDNYLKQRSD